MPPTGAPPRDVHGQVKGNRPCSLRALECSQIARASLYSGCREIHAVILEDSGVTSIDWGTVQAFVKPI